jgi:ribosome-interacting GTPase 1
MADAALLVVDLSAPSCVEEVGTVQALLRERRVYLTAQWGAPVAGGGPEESDPFALRLPTLLLANKVDEVADAAAELEVLRELAGITLPMLPISAATGRGLAEIGPWLFRELGVIRVYTKLPGKPADRERPFTLRRGQTVRDVARMVHKDLERSLRFARVTGRAGFEGQHVGPEHSVDDGDVVELHG